MMANENSSGHGHDKLKFYHYCCFKKNVTFCIFAMLKETCCDDFLVFDKNDAILVSKNFGGWQVWGKAFCWGQHVSPCSPVAPPP